MGINSYVYEVSNNAISLKKKKTTTRRTNMQKSLRLFGKYAIVCLL